MAIIGANIVVFCLWKTWPPAWRLLNRYFISVPLYPNAFSVVGSNFSHQQLKHLTMNMAILWFIGTRRKFLNFVTFFSFIQPTSNVCTKILQPTDFMR